MVTLKESVHRCLPFPLSLVWPGLYCCHTVVNFVMFFNLAHGRAIIPQDSSKLLPSFPTMSNVIVLLSSKQCSRSSRCAHSRQDSKTTDSKRPLQRPSRTHCHIFGHHLMTTILHVHMMSAMAGGPNVPKYDCLVIPLNLPLGSYL
jgi:hypothetical protein